MEDIGEKLLQNEEYLEINQPKMGNTFEKLPQNGEDLRETTPK